MGFRVCVAKMAATATASKLDRSLPFKQFTINGFSCCFWPWFCCRYAPITFCAIPSKYSAAPACRGHSLFCSSDTFRITSEPSIVTRSARSMQCVRSNCLISVTDTSP